MISYHSNNSWSNLNMLAMKNSWIWIRLILIHLNLLDGEYFNKFYLHMILRLSILHSNWNLQVVFIVFICALHQGKKPNNEGCKAWCYAYWKMGHWNPYYIMFEYGLPWEEKKVKSIIVGYKFTNHWIATMNNTCGQQDQHGMRKFFFSHLKFYFVSRI
jgi:hypothetical protein